MDLDTSWDLYNAMVLPCHLGTWHRPFAKELMERNVPVVLESNDALGIQNPSLGQDLLERLYNPAIVALASLEIVPALVQAVDLGPPESHPYLLHQQALACDTLTHVFRIFKLSHISDICK